MRSTRILVDSSVWIDYLRKGQSGIKKLVSDPGFGCHPFVIGELAAGCLSNRTNVISTLQSIFQFSIVPDCDVLKLIEDHKIYGKGISYIDFHLLTSTNSTANSLLWTFDKRLRTAASKLGIAYFQTTEQENFLR